MGSDLNRTDIEPEKPITTAHIDISCGPPGQGIGEDMPLESDIGGRIKEAVARVLIKIKCGTVKEGSPDPPLLKNATPPDRCSTPVRIGGKGVQGQVLGQIQGSIQIEVEAMALRRRASLYLRIGELCAGSEVYLTVFPIA
jgi:hypothetical protein